MPKGTNPKPKGEASAGWKGDAVSYVALHLRLQRVRGRAAENRCQHCSAQASHWAYDHSDANEKRNGNWPPYSTDLMRYIPLCAPCHRRFDVKSDRNARKTHCPQRHPYDSTNTRITRTGTRKCRTCERDRTRARRAR